MNITDAELLLAEFQAALPLIIGGDTVTVYGVEWSEPHLVQTEIKRMLDFIFALKKFELFDKASEKLVNEAEEFRYETPEGLREEKRVPFSQLNPQAAYWKGQIEQLDPELNPPPYTQPTYFKRMIPQRLYQ